MHARLARRAVGAATQASAGRSCASQTIAGRRLPVRCFTPSAFSSADSSTSATNGNNDNGKKAPFIHRFLHGNQEAQEEIEQAVQERETNFSQKIARGKYVHEFMVHDVKPDCVDKYLELM